MSTTRAPSWEAPIFVAADGAIVEATLDWLEAYAETPEQAATRELLEAVKALTTARATISVARQLPADLLALRDTGQSVRTLRAAIAKSELPAVKVGREFQVRRSDLEAWLNARAVAPRERAAPELSAADRAIAAAQRKGALRLV